MTNKLNVLLIDDRGAVDLGAGKYPYVRGGLANHFNIIWIRDAYEGRWLLDAFEELRNFDPSRLFNIGIPPESMIFDYALTQGRDRATARENDPTDIIPFLSNLVKQLQIDMPTLPGEYERIPDTGTEPGKDRMGCYIGGELAHAFSSYPCGAIPTTAHVSVEGSDAAFYEWLNDRYFSSAFADKTREIPMWGPVIKSSIQEYRERLIKLTHSGSVIPSIIALQTLIEKPEMSLGKCENNTYLGTFSYSTYFGKREIMVSSVFFDALFPAENLIDYDDGTLKPSIQDFSGEARLWAEKMLKALFNNKQGHNEFTEARDIADLYFKAFISDYHLDRYAISEQLISQAETDDFKEFCHNLKAQDPDKYENFVDRRNKCESYEEFFVTELKISEKDFRKITKQRMEVLAEALKDSKLITIKPLYQASNNASVVRLAVLMLMVYGEKHFSNRLPDISSILTYESIKEEKKALAPTSLKLKTVCEMIDPLPNSLLTFYSKGKDGYTTITNQLKNLGKGSGSYGSLGLNIRDVIGGKFNLGNDNHGLFPSDLKWLRAFAQDINFPKKQWPAWLKKQP